MTEAPGLVAGLDDVAMMGKTIKKRRRHLRIGEDSVPFAEAQVGRNHHAGVLVELGE